MSKKKVKKGKRRFRIFLLVMIFLILLLFAVVMLCAYVFKVPTRSIIVQGNSIVSDEEILKSAGLDHDSNFILTSSNDVENSVKKNSFIKSVKVKKNWLLEINIYVEEYKPFFIREDTNTIVTSSGDEISNSEDYNLAIPSLINYVPDTKYKDLIKKMNRIDYSLIKKISQIMYSPTKYDEYRFILYMNDSNRVYINLPKFKSFNKYDEMVTKFEGKTGRLYLDSGNYFEIDK